MNITEAWNRGNNLLAVAITFLAGMAFLPVGFTESELAFKLDEFLIAVIAILAAIWYLKGRNKFKRSIAPLLFVYFAFLVKIVAVVIEFRDKEDVGDDFGALILFFAASIIVTWLYVKSKKHFNSPSNT